MADTPIDNLLITIKQTGGGEVARTLESMAKGLRALRDSASGTKATAFNNLASGIKTIADATANLKGVENLERMAAALERLKALGAIKIKVPKISTSGKGGSNGGTVSGSGTASGDGGAGGVADELEATADKLENLTMSAKEADKVLASLKNKYFGWMKAIGRVAIYRAIRSVIKSIMQSLNDGLEHFYQYSLKVEGLYATARAEIKTSMHYVSDALGAAAGQLIEKIYPVVVKILDATAEIFNNISEMIAHLSGEETYTRAVRGIADINAEAKKLKATILGFDEINKLNGNNGSGADETGHFEEAKVNKMRASVTAGIMSGLGALVAGSGIASITADVIKLTEALGVKGLAGAAQKASEAIGTAGSGGAGGSGLLGKLAAGVGAAVLLKMGDIHFENMLAAEEADQKVVQGIQAAIGGIGAVALGYAAGGIPGVVITIGAMIKMVVDDIVLDDNTRNKVKNGLDEFGDSLPGNDSGRYAREDLSKVGEDLDRYAENMKNATGFLDKVDAWLKLNGDVLAHGLSAFGDTIDSRIDEAWNNIRGSFTNSDPNWTWRQGVTDLADYYGFDIDPGSSDINVIVELDGEVLARGVSNAGNRINYRGGNYDELR